MSEARLCIHSPRRLPRQDKAAWKTVLAFKADKKTRELTLPLTDGKVDEALVRK